MASSLPRILKVFLLFLALIVVGVTLLVGFFSATLPKIIKPTEYKPMVVSEVFADKGEKIGEFFELRRKPVALDQIPKSLIQAFLAAEDSHFYSHKGIDIRGVIRAAIKNFQAGRVVQGGSTITQQVARNLLLTREKKISRKIKEMVLSMRLEKELSKDEILYLYLNEIYLGHGAYGVQAASQNYFGKNVSDLTLAESAMMAGLPQAPSRYSPLISTKLAKERQIYVLGRMMEDGYVSKRQAIEARDEILHFLKRRDFNLRFSPYFVEHVRRYLVDKYGYEKVYQEGLQIHTTLNLDFQKAANVAVEKGLRDLDKRQGYRGPDRRLEKSKIEPFLKEQSEKELFEIGEIVEAVVTEVNDQEKRVIVKFGESSGEIPFEEMRWAREPNPDKYYLEGLIRRPSQALSVGDIVKIRLLEKKKPHDHVMLEQEPQVQGALLSYEQNSGAIRAMVGGYDFSESEFNRTIQGQRQVGSTFKPIIYAAALERGYTPAKIVVDSPVIYKEGESEVVEKWKPRNFAEKFYGDTILANGLAFSRNIVTIKVAQDISVDYISDFARRLGVKSPLIEDLSMALGSSSLTLEEMCHAFAVFARQGKPMHSYFIKKILDREGTIMEEFHPPEKEPEPVISPPLAYAMTHMLKRVIDSGTGKDVKDLNWPLAGKTGTTSNYVDAWFLGFSPDILTGTWVGFDQSRKMGEFETGSKAAIPIWKDYMRQVLSNYPKRDFQVPPGVVFVNIDAQTGHLATSETKFPVSLAFIEGTEPQEDSEAQERHKDDKNEEKFFKENL